MKKCIFYLLPFLFALEAINAQSLLPKVDSLVNDIRLIAEKTDNLILHKIKMDSEGYHSGNSTNSFEWLFELYYDAKGVLRKSNSFYYHDEVICTIYYDTNGMAIYTSYFSLSDANGSYSIERYLHNDEELLYLNHIGKGTEYYNISDVELIEQEIIILKLMNVTSIPAIRNTFYDNVLSVSDFQNTFLHVFDSEGLRYNGEFPRAPEDKKVAVKFTMPEKGDVAFLTQNKVAFYEKPKGDILFTLNIRHDIKIIDVIKDWYKISITTYGSDTIEGYIHGEFIAPVERPAE